MTIDWAIFQHFVITIIATAIGAFAGASAAFLWQKRQKKDEENERNLIAGNYAIFIMLQQHGVLNSLKKQLIDPHRDDPIKWINIPAIPSRNHDDLHFDKIRLQFILNSDNPNLLTEVMLEEQRFFEAIKVLNERSNIHLNILQPALEKLGIQPGETYSDIKKLENALGLVVVNKLRTLTSGFVEHMDEGIEGIKKICGELEGLLRRMFPGRRVIKVNYEQAEKS